MKKILPVIACALGSGLAGYFANQLNTILGACLFTLGTIMLAASCVVLLKRN